MYISSFSDPTVALETTQSNQTYAFEQQDQSYGDVEDELNLSPDWSNEYFTLEYNGLVYESVDQLEWQLLQPTSIEEINQSPDVIINESTTLSNDFRPTRRSDYALDLSYPDRSTIQTQAGK